MHKICSNNNNNNIIKSAGNKNNVMKIMDNKYTKNQVELLSEIGEKEIGRIYVFSVDFIIQHAACIKF